MGASDQETRYLAPNQQLQAELRMRGIAGQLDRRLWMLSWWRHMMSIHPGGFVPLSTAARVLGVSIRRVNELVKQQRFSAYEMPEGTRFDVFIPIDSLLAAPNRLQTGQRFRSTRKVLGPDPENPYFDPVHKPKTKKILPGRQKSRKSIKDNELQ